MPQLSPWLAFFVVLGIALVAALVLVAIVAGIARLFARRREWPKSLTSRARHPFRLLMLVIAVVAAVQLAFPAPTYLGLVQHGLLIAAIVAIAWLLGALLGFAIGIGMSRYRTDIPDNKVARRMHTQLAIVSRLVNVVITILAIGAILLTFPGVEAVGTSVLASAGLVSVVAGLAAQSTLANVFAGIQLAFSDAIRVDDVVIVENEWGRIEEVTLSYVVVHLWDDRRMVLPSTWFTTKPFQNWTRNSSELLGAVEFDLDWRISPSAMRVELEKVLQRATIWDGRASVLQVTDAVGGFVRVRILVTAIDAPTLFDLRCYIREEMVEWIQAQGAGLPRQRIELVEAAVKKPERTKTEPIGLFTGTVDAQERAAQFTSSIPLPGHVAVTHDAR
ncbi:mechanosensitive ion channel [Glaciihabitans arcticus]|uniref:Mechanosensitive ion channel n=1 Tax=Glaciihabitans arcticus TaxID=2668039 RepID=A0A4Q9H045_9MICO|nr:mechanosensitive ion channel domain-containing protein [Glaciihabitans arcticus]TBN58050.1 mechanosensitive ion channel [Glaciihabitans arcticus]